MESWQELTRLCQRQGVVVVGCGKRKGPRQTRAELLYQGSYFRSCLTLAKKLVGRERVFILSAKYGLLSLDQIICPYDTKLTTLSQADRQRWFVKVRKQMRQSIGTRPVYFLCSRQYTTGLHGTHLLPPTGMGYQLQWMRKRLAESAHSSFASKYLR